LTVKHYTRKDFAQVSKNKKKYSSLKIIIIQEENKLNTILFFALK